MAADFREFIEEKTVAGLNDALGTNKNTIYSWAHLNRIPRAVWPDLLSEYDDLTIGRLKAWEALSKSPG